MIGDDIVGDVGGAQKCGMRALQVRTGKFRSVPMATSFSCSSLALSRMPAFSTWGFSFQTNKQYADTHGLVCSWPLRISAADLCSRNRCLSLSGGGGEAALGAEPELQGRRGSVWHEDEKLCLS